MKLLSIGKTLHYEGLDIVSISLFDLMKQTDIDRYDYAIIHGGDGTIRRVLQKLYTTYIDTVFIINPTDSFNLIAKLHGTSQIQQILKKIAHEESIITSTQHFHKLNQHFFLFSAGNMGDLQHIIIAETLRFGWIEFGALRYIFTLVMMLPLHFLFTPFMLMSRRKFFIFTPIKWIRKFGGFYGQVQDMTIDLKSYHNIIELDGDIVTIEENLLHIRTIGNITIAIG